MRKGPSKVKSCVICGAPLDDTDIKNQRGDCKSCRSISGKVADLDIAIRASGDNPERINEWAVIRHFLRKRFGEDLCEVDLWERCTDWLRAKGLSPNEYSILSLEELRRLIEDEIAQKSGQHHRNPGDVVSKKDLDEVVAPADVKTVQNVAGGAGGGELVSEINLCEQAELIVPELKEAKKSSWIRATELAGFRNSENPETAIKTLSDYRTRKSYYQLNETICGVDKDGRQWRTDKSGKVWYFRESLPHDDQKLIKKFSKKQLRS